MSRYPNIVVTISPKLRAQRIRQLVEKAMQSNGVSKSNIARFRVDCLDHGTLEAARRWVTVKASTRTGVTDAPV